VSYAGRATHCTRLVAITDSSRLNSSVISRSNVDDISTSAECLHWIADTCAFYSMVNSMESLHDYGACELDKNLAKRDMYMTTRMAAFGGVTMHTLTHSTSVHN
jgi:hypothetical protein